MSVNYLIFAEFLVFCEVLRIKLLVIIFVPHRNFLRFTNQSTKQLDPNTSRLIQLVDRVTQKGDLDRKESTTVSKCL